MSSIASAIPSAGKPAFCKALSNPPASEGANPNALLVEFITFSISSCLPATSSRASISDCIWLNLIDPAFVFFWIFSRFALSLAFLIFRLSNCFLDRTVSPFATSNSCPAIEEALVKLEILDFCNWFAIFS